MTFEQVFVAVRHESELLTPVFQMPMMNFSLRELGYVMSFVMAIVFGTLEAVPIEVVYMTFALFVLAFVKIRGVIPEMYLYYLITAPPMSKTKKSRKKKEKHVGSSIVGFGESVEMEYDEEEIEETQEIKFSDNDSPLDVTLDIGKARAFQEVTVMIDGNRVATDMTNGSGNITVTLLPRTGLTRFKILDPDGGVILEKDVMFAGGEP